MTDHSLQRLIDETDNDLGHLMPHVKQRLKTRMLLAYWQGVNDAHKESYDPAAERRSKPRGKLPNQMNLSLESK